MSNLRNRTLERTLKREFRARCQATNAVCWRCRQPINYRAQPQAPDAFEVDHKYPVSTHPDLAYQVHLWRPSHSRCNRSAGANPPPTAARWVRANWTA